MANQKTVASKDALGWAVWTIENTDMPQSRVVRRAAQKFGEPQAAIKRGLEERLSPEFLADRSARMRRQGWERAKAQNPEIAAEARRRSRMIQDAKRAERHVQDIGQGVD